MTNSHSQAAIRVLQHHDDTPVELLGEWMTERGLAARTLRPDRGEDVPTDPSGWDGLVILGAEHSVNAVDPPWIATEIQLTKNALELGVPVLGLCFGGQMLARVLGAEVGPIDGPPRIGWHEVVAAAGSPAAGEWLHYNYEAFPLPPGADSLAELNGSAAAFRVGPHLGVQFHPEATPEIVHAWAALEPERLRAMGLDPPALIDASEERRASARERAFALFDSWVDARA
jgi:GMP synthase-like glutamine amidotransferase